MPTSLRRLGQLMYRALFEVPGWPDAPQWVRFRRALPIFVPAALALLLIAASELVHKPHMNSVRRAHAGLLSMQEELEGMRLQWSDQQAQEMERQVEAISNHLLPSAREAENFLDGFREEFESLGWDYRFQAYEAPADAAGEKHQMTWAPALLRMRALTGNETPLASFLEAADRLRSSGPGVEITRLSVTVNDVDEPFVEMNLRIACAVQDEKAAE